MRTGHRFQSTRPVWDATRSCNPCRLRPSDFNPRAPCGARPGFVRWGNRARKISIHAPRVGRDSTSVHSRAVATISIHAPRVGRD